MDNVRCEILTPEKLSELAASVPGAMALLPQATYLCSGVSRALFIEGKPVGFCGVFPLWQGVGEAWAIFRPQAMRHPRWIRRTCFEVLGQARQQMALHRIQCVADLEEKHHSRWPISLGFEFEGIMKQFTSDKKDMARYTLTFQEEN